MDLFDIAIAKKLAGGGGGGGGSASNVVMGTLTTPEVVDVTFKKEELDIDYKGAGYPVALFIRIKGSAKPELDSLIAQNGIFAYAFFKLYASTEPTYTGSGTANTADGFACYKSSNTDGQYTTKNNASISPYNENGATASSSNINRAFMFKDETTLSFIVGMNNSGNYGLLANTEYEYIVIYSE